MNLEKNALIAQIEKEASVVKSLKARYLADHLFEFNRDVLCWPDLSDDFHKELCLFIEKEHPRKKLMLLPRGHLKSSIVTVGFTLQQIAKNPATRILIANATLLMAKNFLAQIKAHLTKNKKFKDLYGDYSKGAEKWSETAITVLSPNESFDEKYLEKKEPTVTVFGAGGNLTGQHYDTIILDDVVNRENINTKEQIDKIILFYKDCLDLLEPGGTLILIGTRWHYGDLYGWLMEDPILKKDFDIMVRQAYYGEWGRGTILFPKKFSWASLEELKRQKGSSEFACQYMNSPTDEETAVFKRAWFKYYEDSDLHGLKLNYFMAVDPAISQEKEADFTAIVTVGVDIYNNLRIINLVREHYNPTQLINKLFDLYEVYYPLAIGLEEVAFQKTLRFFLSEEMRRRNIYLPIKELKLDSRVSKEMRIRALEPRYENGTVLHSKSLGSIDDLEDELLRFPRGQHDDLIDALAYTLQLAFQPKKKVTEKHNKYLY